MPNAFQNFHNNLLAQSMASYGSQVIYKENPYTAVVGQWRIALVPDKGGIREDLALSVVFKLTDLSFVPATDDVFSVNGKNVRVKDVETDEVSYTLLCVTANF